MKKNLKEEVASYKRQRILEEACHLFFENGYERTTLDSVADCLDVTKPFIYSYYANKGEILFDICQTGIQLSLKALNDALALEGTALSRLKALVESVSRIVIEEQEYIVVYLREEKNLEPQKINDIRQLRNEFDHKLAELLAEGVTSGEFDVENTLLTAISIGGLISWTANWYNPSGKWSVTEVVMHAIQLVMSMVKIR